MPRPSRRLIAFAAFAAIAVGALVVLAQSRVPHRAYRATEGGLAPPLLRDTTPTHPYSLGFIEFDDQGFFWDPSQLDSLVAHVRREAAGRGVVLIAFAHGWNHDASPADNNVACFREVVRAAAMLQRANHRTDPSRARAVVGVYLGWRGSVFEPGWLNQALTFWNRVEVADRVGARGDLLRTLITLRDLRATVEPRRTRLVIAGHSMGARAVFAALSPFYKEHAFRGAARVGGTDPSASGWDVTQSFGDLVVLLNPAFSASEYKPIDAASRAARTDAAAQMDPNMLIVSSVADGATRDHYPRAQRMATWWQSFGSKEDRTALSTTVGNYEPFATHRLVLASGSIPAEPSIDPARGCPYLEAERLDVTRGLDRVANAEALFEYRRIDHFDASGEFGDAHRLYTTELQAIAGSADGRGPFMVVRADSVLIPGHNEIFSPGFVDFLVRVVNKKAR